ncbi:hypothetical protein DSOL_3243 [Desulfosporosinus metallidurans]|uniref:Uncharacterized protein n=1 Tax=Desulfosporosinus metallidurans TaxID=1888891 RepID=A0A1Q8QRY3_9FIRM|nr:hypothetical protein DSOL_3243 [Desulfosporosinus metallidurans]
MKGVEMGISKNLFLHQGGNLSCRWTMGGVTVNRAGNFSL